MAITTEQLRYLISLNSDDAVRGFQKVGNAAEKELGKADDQTNKLNLSLTRWGAAGVAAAGIAGAGLLKFASASGEAQAEADKLDNTLANAPQLAGASAKAFTDLAEATQDKTAADGDAIVGMEALAGQMGLNQRQILELTPLVVDLARKTGSDLDSAMLAAVKSVDGQTRGLKGLGVEVDANAAKTDSYAATVTALQQSVGGFAEKEGQRFSGQLARFKNELGDVEEAVGGGVIPVFSKLFGVVEGGAHVFTSLPSGVRSTVGTVLALGTAAVGTAGGISFLVGQASKLADTARMVASAVTSIPPPLVAVGGALAVGGILYEQYASRQQQATQVKNEFVTAIQNETQGLAENTDKLIANKLVASDLDETAASFGLSIANIADVVRGKANPAWDDFHDKLEQANRTSAEAVGWSTAQQNEAVELSRDVGRLSSAYTGATEEIDRQNEAQRALSGQAGATQSSINALGVEIDNLPDKTTVEVEADTGPAMQAIGAVRAALDALIGKPPDPKPIGDVFSSVADTVSKNADKAAAAQKKAASAGASAADQAESDAKKAQSDAEKAAKDKQDAQEKATHDYLVAIDNAQKQQREMEDNQYEFGVISADKYKQILEERLAHEKEFSAEWATEKRKLTRIIEEENRKQVDSEKKKLDDLKKLEDEASGGGPFAGMSDKEIAEELYRRQMAGGDVQYSQLGADLAAGKYDSAGSTSQVSSNPNYGQPGGTTIYAQNINLNPNTTMTPQEVAKASAEWARTSGQ